MSAAQALTGPVTSSPSVRPSSSGVAGSDAGFRDALETASRSNEGSESGRDRVASDRTGREEANRDDADKGGGGETQRDSALSVHRADATPATELSAMLAALGAGRSAQADAGDLGAEQALPPVGGVEIPDASPVLPGDNDAPLDGAQLLALLRSGKASPADLPVETVDIKVTVGAQETHLALDKVSAEAVAALSAPETAAAASPEGEGGAAVLSRVADDAAKSVRQRNGVSAVQSEAGPGPRAVTTADAWSGRGGSTAFADQGIAGHGGSPSDGRGTSGGGAQQQGTGAFLAALAGANLQTAGTASQPAGTGVVVEPVSEQIAQHVRAEIKADGLGEASSEGVVKVLNLELKPANMGSVTVRIALKDNAITVHLEAQRAETLAVIEREREALTKALTSAGYSIDSITAAPQGEASRSLGAAFAGLGNGSPASQGGFSSQAGQGQGLSNSAGGQGGSAQDGGGNSSYRHPSDDKDTGGGGIRRGADGLYV